MVYQDIVLLIQSPRRGVSISPTLFFFYRTPDRLSAHNPFYTVLCTPHSRWCIKTEPYSYCALSYSTPDGYQQLALFFHSTPDGVSAHSPFYTVHCTPHSRWRIKTQPYSYCAAGGVSADSPFLQHSRWVSANSPPLFLQHSRRCIST